MLHDAVLHHFLLGQMDEAAYIDEFAYNYGEWSRGLARELWRGRAASGADSRYFDYALLKRIAERALAVVVHTPKAARAVGEHAPGARVVEIPHLFQPPAAPPLEADVMRYRQRLGIAPGAIVFGVFGYLRESKRLTNILAAFAEARRDLQDAVLLVAGAFASSDLERAVQPMFGVPGIIRLPYLDDRDFWLAASAVDACINLRYPAAGEASGIAIRLMGIGKPVMLSEGAEAAPFPEGACVRVATGVGERESLRAHLILLTSFPEVARAIGGRGAGHIKAHHRVEQIGKQYWDLLCEFCASV